MEDKDIEFDKKVLDICQNDYMDFFKKPNVVGIALGYQVTDRQYTGKKCLRVFVSNKFWPDYLSDEEKIPSTYKGIKTDVILSGEIVASSFSGKIRPMIGGYGISNTNGGQVGTVGCLVKDEKEYYVLSNNHVMAQKNETPLGTPIVQPSVQDGGQDPEDTIGTLSNFIPLKFKTDDETPENFVDCAIAKVKDKELVSNKVAFVGEPIGIIPPKLDLFVQKTGKITEQTMGTVVGLGATILVEYDDGKKALFKNQIVTTKMTHEGDSGSLLMDSDANAVGLFFAHTDKHSFHNDISKVLDSLKVTLVTK